MKRALSSTLALISFGFTTFAVIAAHAQTTAPGPYYATPSWDQKITTGRFVVLSNWNNEAVLDRETGLVWERSPDPSTSNWFAALSYCLEINTGGRRGWRLPTVQDLLSLVDDSASNPSLPGGHPFTNVQSLYWAATTQASNSAQARSVGFNFGKVFVGDKQSSNQIAAWCVRGGQVVDPQ
jgi:hypothetical protein